MGPLDKLESTLSDALDKNAPIKMPEEWRRGIAKSLWWIVLVVGVLQLWAAMTLWRWGHVVDRTVDVVNGYLGQAAVNHLGLFYYLSLWTMVAIGVLLLLAAPNLKAMRKSGWNLLYYAAAFQVLVAVVRLFSSVGGGIGGFLSGGISALIGAYVLFQVRDYFVMSKIASHSAAAHKQPEAHNADKPDHADKAHKKAD